MKRKSSSACPCGSTDYETCCGAYISGNVQAPTAEALMRSRYTAYARQDANYLLRTWHPATRPKQLNFDPATKWIGLKILDTDAGQENDETGLVEFIARYKQNGKAEKLHERSQFVRLDELWVYTTGD